MSQRSLFRRTLQLFRGRMGAYFSIGIIPNVVFVPSIFGLLQFRLLAIADMQHPDPVQLWSRLTGETKLLEVLLFELPIWVPQFTAARGICRITDKQLRDSSFLKCLVTISVNL